jgi:hypothetical protein
MNSSDNAHVVVYPKPSATPDAVDLSIGAPKNFPIVDFPPLLRTVAENMAEVYQTPVCLPAMSALAVLSGAVGKSVVIQGGYKDKLTRLNLYVIAVAERGCGKGNVGETLCGPLSRRSKELADQHRKIAAVKCGELGALKREIGILEGQAAKATGSERANLLDSLSNRHARLAELEVAAAREVTLLVGDTTSEALARVLADNKEELFTYSAEAGAAVKVALGKYSDKGESDCDLLLSSYSGDSVRTSRVTRKGVQLENPCLALLWLVQDCIARKLFGDSEAVNRGLTARLLIFDTGARREHDDRKSLTFSQETNWSNFLAGILDRRLADDAPLEIICTAEAREVFAQFHDVSVDLERGAFADLTGELSRWRENAIKVAGLFALAESKTTISADVAARACAVVRWCGFNYLGLLQSGRRERMHEEFERVAQLLRSNGGEMPVGRLASAHGIKREQLNALVAMFPAELEIERRAQAGAGRPAEVVRLKTNSSKSSKSNGEDK